MRAPLKQPVVLLVSTLSPLWLSCIASCSGSSSSGSTSLTAGGAAMGGSGGQAASAGGSVAQSGGGSTALNAGGSGGSIGGTGGSSGGVVNSAGGGGTGGALSTGGMGGAAGSGGAGGESGGGGAAGTGGSANAAGVCPPGPYADNPLPADLTLTTLCPGMHTSEGIVWFADLNVAFFSNFDSGDVAGNFNGNIVRYTPGTGCETFVTDVGTNGLAIAPDGQLLAVSHKTQEVLKFDLTTKQSTSLASLYMNMHFGSPNDIAAHKSGSIYFTDPAAEKGTRPQELPTAVYRIDPQGQLTVVDQVDKANGVNFSPDESLLYVSNYDSFVRVYDVAPDGVASNGRQFLGVGSDGMTVDCAGNVYTTAGEVRVWSPTGQMIGTIHGTGTATNVAFGGPDKKTLFITSFAGDLKSVELNIPGMPY